MIQIIIPFYQLYHDGIQNRKDRLKVISIRVYSSTVVIRDIRPIVSYYVIGFLGNSISLLLPLWFIMLSCICFALQPILFRNIYFISLYIKCFYFPIQVIPNELGTWAFIIDSH